MLKRLSICFIPLALLFHSVSVAEESQLWSAFAEAKLSGSQHELPDFSYAGYNYSETTIPDTSAWPVFNVTDFGAIADDGEFDDEAIQQTIDAASANGGGVVYFPEGRYRVSPNENVGENIFVRTSNIVLKGDGSQRSEIFMDSMKVKNGRNIIEIGPEDLGETTLTTVIEGAKRETYSIAVADASLLNVGQRIILRTDSVEFGIKYYEPQSISQDWLRLLDIDDDGGAVDGFHLREIHTIANIEGNQVTFREPLHIDLNLVDEDILVRSYNVITNVGVEDLLFKGNWGSYPEVFVHHKDDIHDYAWNALRMDNVANGWIRNSEFKDWNQVIYLDGSQAVTIENVLISGKKGHSSIHTRRSYGILIKDSTDTAGHHHGPGVGYWNAGTVYLRYNMSDEQRIDSHSGSPYATLLDNVVNGQIYGSGGSHESYPHHGKYFTFWNFLLKGGPNSYDFWPNSRNGNTFAMPYFIGLQGKEVTLKAGTFGANELQGQVAEPQSLFEAQLSLRIDNSNYGVDYQIEAVPFTQAEDEQTTDTGSNNDDTNADETIEPVETASSGSSINWRLVVLSLMVLSIRNLRRRCV